MPALWKVASALGGILALFSSPVFAQTPPSQDAPAPKEQAKARYSEAEQSYRAKNFSRP